MTDKPRRPAKADADALTPIRSRLDLEADLTRDRLTRQREEDSSERDDAKATETEEGDKPREPEGPTLPLGAFGVALPLRIETRFRGTELRVRVIPDEPWISRHDPRPTSAELDAVEDYRTAVERGEDREVAWQRLAGHHGGGRALWLMRTFPVAERGDDGRVRVQRPSQTADDAQRVAEIRGLPAQLEVWLARDGQAARRAAVMLVDHDKLTLDPAVADDPDKRGWLDSWEGAVEAGLATTIDLGPTADDIDALYVVGVAGGNAGELFGEHRDAGRLRVLDPGTPTATVDGEDSAGRRAAPEEYLELLSARPGFGQARLSAALTGDPFGLGALPGGEGTQPMPLVAALWPALWGHALKDVWGLATAVDDAAPWAIQHLAPEGPLPIVQIGAQPYGVLPTTALGGWRPADGDPAAEAQLRVALLTLRRVWAAAAEGAGTVEAADAERLLDLIARVPVSERYGQRLAWPLEKWLYALILTGYQPAWSHLVAEWDARYPLVGQLGLDPVRRYGARGWTAGLRVPLVAEGPEVEMDKVLEPLGKLVDAAAARPHLFADTFRVEQEVLGRPTLTLLEKLVLRSLQVALGDVGREVLGAPTPELGGTSWPSGDNTALGQWIRAVEPDHVEGETPAAQALSRTVEGIRHLGGYGLAELERLLRATIDCAVYRIDAWVGAPAWRRLAERIAKPRGLVVRLCAYGWVDRPRPGHPGPTEGGLVQAPSQQQAKTAAILRDRAVFDDEGGRWHMEVDSASARAAARLADRVRAGAHLAEALGAEVERAVGDPAKIHKLRQELPVHPDHDGRRVCDGMAVINAAPSDLPVDVGASAREAFAELRAAVDAYGDLLVAEAVHDYVEGRAEATAAALDAAAGLARPPDMQVLRTRRQGRSVATGCVAVLPGVKAPGRPDDEKAASELHPGVVADASVAATLADLLGGAQDWQWAFDGGGSVTLADLGLEPADALAVPLPELERLAARAAGAARDDLAAADGSDRYRRAEELLAALGRRPGGPADLSEEQAPEPDANAERAVADELRHRLGVLGAAARALLTRLEGVGGNEGAAEEALRLAARWGIVPPLDDPPAERAARAAQLLARRLDAAPGGQEADDLGAVELADAIGALASRTGNVAVLGLVPAGRVPDSLDGAAAVDGEWLPVVAAVRESLARVDALQLAGEARDGVAPLRGWANRPDDMWQTAAGPGADRRRLVVAYAPAGVAIDAGGLGDAAAVGLIDRWSETVPATAQHAAGAFGFDAPAARAPQAILLAVPPDPDAPIDARTLVETLAETRELLRARMAEPADLAEVDALAPTALLPAAGPTRVYLR